MKIAVMPGDGIGPEVVGQTIKVLNAVSEKYKLKFEYDYLDLGGVSIDKTGLPLTDETLERAKSADAVLLGAVGGPKWDNCEIRPERGLLGIREGLNVYANLRPSVLYEELKQSCPLKDEIIKDGLDILIVRELTGGIYFGDRGRLDNGESAYDTEKYSKLEIERIINKAVASAMSRRKKITLVDKANVLESSRLWREVAKTIFDKYKDLEIDYMYVDNASMQLVKNPSQFDVIVTSNMFGDILSDEASMLTGSIGLLPSASLGDGNTGLYEPIHGSAPDIAGKGIANPLATILAAKMMLEYSFGLYDAASDIEKSVKKFLKDGYRTPDLIINNITENITVLNTEDVGTEICRNILS